MKKVVLFSQVTLVVGVVALIIGLFAGGVWYITRPTMYDFGNGARLTVPWGAVSVDQRPKGYGVVVQSGVNVVVRNDSDGWRTLTVCYRKYNYGILDTHAFEDLPPKSFKTFGADPVKYEGMHVSVSDFAQKERDKDTKTDI
jgi:hypothetical protein